MVFTQVVMNKKIKLIWEFRGPTAEQTAKHHVIHLKEYMALQNFDFDKSAVDITSEFNCSAYLITNEEYLQQLRSDLKPNRGTYYNPKENE